MGGALRPVRAFRRGAFRAEPEPLRVPRPSAPRRASGPGRKWLRAGRARETNHPVRFLLEAARPPSPSSPRRRGSVRAEFRVERTSRGRPTPEPHCISVAGNHQAPFGLHRIFPLRYPGLRFGAGRKFLPRQGERGPGARGRSLSQTLAWVGKQDQERDDGAQPHPDPAPLLQSRFHAQSSKSGVHPCLSSEYTAVWWP